MTCSIRSHVVFASRVLFGFSKWMVTLLSLAFFVPGYAYAVELRCAHWNQIVHAADLEQAEAACEAATSALDFLSAQGFDTSGRVEVHLVEVLPSPCGLHSFGCYSHPDRRINVLTVAKCLRLKTWQGVPLNQSLCRSFLAHEVAHAVATVNFRLEKPSLLAQEYLAGVTTVAILPPEQRELLLEQLPGKGFESADQISTTYYLLSPARFSVGVYRHYQRLSDPKAFVQKVLEGRVLARDY